MEPIPLLPFSDLITAAKGNGWTIPALCQEADVAQSTISRCLRGKNSLNTETYRRVYEVASRPAPAPEAAA